MPNNMRKLITAIAIIIILTACSKQELNIINTKTINEMGKTITTPPDYDITKNQCGTLTLVSGNTYDGSGVTISQIKAALTDTSNASSVLCSSPKINKWAAFKPGHWVLSGGLPYTIFTWQAPLSNFRLGDFIGYNHNAKPPVHYMNDIPSTLNVEEFSNCVIGVYLERGEAEPVNSGCFKTQVDIQVIRSEVTVNDRISVPPLPSYYFKEILFQPKANETVIIRPVYYTPIGGGSFQDMSYIEDGQRSVNIVMIPLAVSGTVTTLANINGVSDQNVTLDWGLSRANSPKTVYARIRVYDLTGRNVIRPVTIDLGVLTFSVNETKTGSIPVTLYLDAIETVTGYINLEVSPDNRWTNVKVIDTTSFVWNTI